MSHIRQKPSRVSYGGMEFKVGILKANGRVDVSYKSQNMKTAFIHEFVPVKGDATASITLKGEYLPENVVRQTLREKLPRYFLAALFKEYPGERNNNICFGLLGEYALIQMHKQSSLAESTKRDEADTFRKMVELWGHWPMISVTPANCGIDLTDNMDTTLAQKCVRLMRKIYPAAVLGSNKDDSVDPYVWTTYTPTGRKPQYSPYRRTRARLINNPPSPGKIREILERCVRAISADEEAARHLAALIVLIEGIDIEEVCALRADSFFAISGYQNEWCLNIDRIVVSLRNDNHNDYVRDSRHAIENIMPPERRQLGVSRLLTSCWNTYAANHAEFKGSQLLLTNPQNKSRILTPEKFRVWLQEHYGDIVPDITLAVAGRDISTSFDVEDALLSASKFLLSDRGGYSAEELRYHYGAKPAEMDGQHYAGFNAPSELVNQGKMQDKALASILGGDYVPNDTGSSKYHRVIGQPECISRIRVEIDVAKMLATVDNEHDLMLRLKALGFSQKITFVEKKQQ